MVLTTKPALQDRVSHQTAASLLDELRQAHSALLDAIAELEAITHEPAPDSERFTAVRWRLSRASLTRRMLWTRILGHLLPRVGEAAADELRQLQDADIDLLRTSIRHVSKWTTQGALADWTAYCAASRTMRGRMAAGIEAEKQLLYPMLEAVGRSEADV